MPPSTSLATLRPDLASSFEELDLEANRRGFIAPQVFPAIDVAKSSGIFGRIPLAQLLQERDTLRAPGSGYARGKFTFTSDSYACVEHGAEEPVDDRESEMYVDFFDAEQVSAQRALNAVLMNAERRVADIVFNAGVGFWNGAALTTAVVNEWDDSVNATPIADIESAIKKVWEGSGLWPNVLIINRRVFRNLRNVAEIVDRIKYAGITDPRAGAITAEAMAQVFDIERVIIAGGARNTATEGQSASIAPVWSDEYAMVARIASSNDPREPCVGRTFHWAGDGSQVEGLMESYREESVRGDIVRVRHDVDEKLLYLQAGHLLSNVTT